MLFDKAMLVGVAFEHGRAFVAHVIQIDGD
jgi:hypothetical protein